MKTARYISLFLFLVLFLIGCKSVNNITKEQVIDKLDNKVQQADYTFAAMRANPMSGQSIQLTSRYTLQVKKDSIIAYLPYFGRAYSAPDPGEEGGIKFVSTDFQYHISEKKKGVYRVSVETNDTTNRYKLSLLIGETGIGTLYVSQLNKQSITFYGNID